MLVGRVMAGQAVGSGITSGLWARGLSRRRGPEGPSRSDDPRERAVWEGVLSVAPLARRALAGLTSPRSATGWLRPVAIGAVRVSGGNAGGLHGLDGRLAAGRLRRQDERHRLGRQVAALHQPLVILLEQQRAGETDDGLVVGEDPDDV